MITRGGLVHHSGDLLHQAYSLPVGTVVYPMQEHLPCIRLICTTVYIKYHHSRGVVCVCTPVCCIV